MENPSTWGEAERIVNRVINDFFAVDPALCGLSLERQITDALREAGLLLHNDTGKQDNANTTTTGATATSTTTRSGTHTYHESQGTVNG